MVDQQVGDMPCMQPTQVQFPYSHLLPQTSPDVTPEHRAQLISIWYTVRITQRMNLCNRLFLLRCQRISWQECGTGTQWSSGWLDWLTCKVSFNAYFEMLLFYILSKPSLWLWPNELSPIFWNISFIHVLSHVMSAFISRPFSLSHKVQRTCHSKPCVPIKN